MISDAVRALDFARYLETIRSFTDQELIPAESEMTARGAVPEPLMERIRELGLFGITLPREWGGLGWSMEQQVRLTFEFTRASCVYRSRFSTTIGLCSQVLLDHGTDEQRERHLRAMAAGECVAAFALTEEAAGSDAGNVRTEARLVDGEWVINGAKRYITNGHWADLLLVFARTDPEQEGAAGTSTLLVERATPGVTTSLPERMNGHEAGPVAEIRFDDVRVPRDRLVGGREGTGLRLALRGINHARTHVAATAVGQATRILEEVARHVGERVQFGVPLSELGAVQAKLGRSWAELEAGRALVLDCARTWDRGERVPHRRIAAAKLYCTETAFAIADRALQLLGGAGIVGDHPIPRLWRDVRALRIYEGASEIHERNLGRWLVSAPALGSARGSG